MTAEELRAYKEGPKLCKGKFDGELVGRQLCRITGQLHPDYQFKSANLPVQLFISRREFPITYLPFG